MNTEEQKARLLVGKFLITVSKSGVIGGDKIFEVAKACAIVCCDEILTTIDKGAYDGQKEYQSYLTIKSEIEKL